MGKKVIIKLSTIFVLILFIVTSINFIGKNKSCNEIYSEKSIEYSKIIFLPEFILPGLKTSNVFILYEFQNNNENKALVKGEISIGRPSGGD